MFASVLQQWPSVLLSYQPQYEGLYRNFVLKVSFTLNLGLVHPVALV
jgi:hypothetical protein